MRRIRKCATCDAYVGVDYSTRSPVILRCKNLATRVVKTGEPGVFSELWLCDSCKHPSEKGATWAVMVRAKKGER